MKLLLSRFFWGNGKIGIRWLTHKRIFQLRIYIFIFDYAIMFRYGKEVKGENEIAVEKK